MSSIEVGQVVPNFTLQAGGGEQVSLEQYRGRKVVIYFYPKDMTPTCTEESCQFRDYNGQFKTLNAEVIGISPDDPKSHEKFAAKHELPFTLLSDPDHTVCELFGVWTLKKMYGKEYMGVVRSTFLIDEEGKLAKEWRKVRVKGHVEQVLEAVKAT
ncbi:MULTISPECIES: thioredoxin-dependent thiol peroxidase [unclassified Paenibacillus]|uniref:thioredoxin-dependent thiol peroxidase n=1 Tax=unclassified Paenibacillus TaxID=185978 RepID=UPI001AEB8688|nr:MULTISPECIES: thioredoxin-dependent thiol peroxidase [unclassified Paenibacillus]MBP1157504.1 peroxiredoxin Q/BCP [Paenibacillus sp. PvP091]MBP1171759.1 peroxiredoxin Q/BCP [Paenibacillus sp. PvR098]MBP2438140.1 peroxiredoxin Q/BCP [Paenibacillus sp. PvP052]